MPYSKKLVEHLYRTMLRIRLCEESFVEPILRGEIRTPCHLYSGQEAIAAGICSLLTKKDYAFGNHRSHGHYLAKGGDMKKLVAEIYGKETGCSKGRGGSMHVIYPQTGFLGSAPIVAGTISLATGAALAVSIRKEKNVVVSFFGDGATNEGALYESMNFASLKKLPIIFVCENNLYSTHMPIKECSARGTLYKVAEPFGIKSYRIDGNDVFKVYEAAKKAVDFCRSGEGPIFIEFLTYRLRGHVGPNDNIQGTQTDIRPLKELEGWRKKDPIPKLEKYLIREKIFSSENINKIKLEVEKEVVEAHKFNQSSPYPKKGDLLKYVFKA